MLMLAVVLAAAPVWTGSVGASYVANSGNENNSTVGGSGQLAWQKNAARVIASTEFIRTTTDHHVGSRRLAAALRAERTLPYRFSLYAVSSYYADVPAGTRRQYAFNVGGIRQVLASEHRALRIMASVTRTQESRVVAPNRDFFGGELGMEAAVKPNATVGLEHAMSIVRDFTDATNWRLKIASSLTAALNRHLAFKVAYQLYRNKPDVGKRAVDQTMLISLVASWPPKSAE